MTLWCVVPAAGKGLRVGGETPKQYLPLASSTVIQQTLARLLVLPAKAVVVAIAADDEKAVTLEYVQDSAARCPSMSGSPVPDTSIHGSVMPDPSICFVTGGAERADSVLAGLMSIAHEAEKDDWVLVHDVARPCVRVDDILLLLDALKDNAVGGLLANRVRDTMKRGVDNRVTETVPRDDLWHALTPQIFRYDVLQKALLAAKEAGMNVTDEAQAVERMGMQPLLVEGARDNIKITWPEDVALAEAFLTMQEKQHGNSPITTNPEKMTSDKVGSDKMNRDTMSHDKKESHQ